MTSVDVELGTKLWDLEQKKKSLQKELDETKKKYQELSEELLEYLVEEELSSTAHINGVGVFAIKKKHYMAVTKANMQQFVDYLKKSGEGAVVKEVVETNTAKAMASEMHTDLTAQISEILEDDGLQGLLDMFASEHPEFHASIADLSDEEISILPAHKLATMCLKHYGISAYEETVLSHTKKGK